VVYNFSFSGNLKSPNVSMCERLWLTGMHLWRSEYKSFIRHAQFEFCRHLIIVPLTTFHRLAETIGDPKGELIFLFNTGRCGSTLLKQVHHWSIDKLFIATI